ncbi:hypothetical protein RI844_06970 [Thalassotalea fonticola]|uniref:AraC family transcriptional regulator n=1 Tax=Thalassotalea fonticola TaxID=3065649 RepID=A0ABZ0GSL2_9GAMM|nr:hypothetical protein RI844_06970 [Colwelliaceae bacterium S1-1]
MKKTITAKISLIAMLCTALFSVNGYSKDVEQELQTLKADMVDIAAEMQILEQQMLYPDAEQLAVYLSVDIAEGFDVSRVKLLLNASEVALINYNDVQMDAFNRGGIERIFIGDIEVGAHTVTAIISGETSNGQKIKRAVSQQVSKAANANVLELSVSYNRNLQQPQFTLVEL